ncbi:leucyl-tRNA synthetase, mitochondrial isoform X2 [Rhynchophorus ferrugineus]
MFPYPSGFLHMGHVRIYTISDALARFQRMNGKNVIHPIGWDAFGLPAENAAIDRQLSPEDWTLKNIDYMREQLKELGCSFEWKRELATCDPVYYRWTQELFLKLFEAGLVYQKEALVNWDPVDQTVLADEQVDENGNSWRSGAHVEKKLLKQWFIRTTQFAKELYDGLNDSVLHDWKDIIKLQKHWIGECDGVNFYFKINNVSLKNSENDSVTVWTRWPEHIEKVRFVAVKDSHLLALKENVKTNGNTIKLNVELINPFNGELVPVFVTEELKFEPLGDCYVGIPSASEEALQFAEKYGLKTDPLNTVDNPDDLTEKQKVICDKAKLLKAGGHWSSAKLRDWLISRQRFWGTPIPIIHCKKCGSVPVDRGDLPVKLPKLSQLSRKDKSPLQDDSSWLNTTCPSCGGDATRETDTMDTFVDSSWYFLRYLDPKYNREMFSKDKAFKMTPVDLYIGGKEHAVLHLYYARFVSHFLHSLGMLPEREPFKRLLVHGMVMGRSFRVKGTGEYIPESRVKIIDMKKNKAVCKETGRPVTISWEKMSKSKHNGVNPEDMFNEYGIDTTRLLILADVSPTSHRNWNSNTFPGILNWQKRLWLTMRDFLKHRNHPPPMIAKDQFKAQENFLWDSRNYYIKGNTFNFVISQQVSIAVSKQQGLTNSIRRSPAAVIAHSLQYERALATQLILLSPLAPHFASELWSGFVSAPNRLNHSGEIDWDKTVLEQDWPEIDADYELDLVCQVNGHENCVVKYKRAALDSLTKDEAVEVALRQSAVQKPLKLRNVLGADFTLHPGCGSTINILTDQPPAKNQVHHVEANT